MVYPSIGKLSYIFEPPSAIICRNTIKKVCLSAQSKKMMCVSRKNVAKCLVDADVCRIGFTKSQTFSGG